MKKFTMIIFLAAFALTAVSCSEKPDSSSQTAKVQEETPQQAMQSIIEYHKNKDFDGLVRNRYAEIAKTNGEEEKIQQVINHFQSLFNDQAKLNQMIAIYESTLSMTPEYDETKSVVKFHIGKGYIKLSKMADGKWGFHL